MISIPIIILVGVLGGLIFGQVRSNADIAAQAYQQQQERQPTSADATKQEPAK